VLQQTPLVGEGEVEREVSAVLPVTHLAQEIGTAAAAALRVAFGRKRQFPLLNLSRQTVTGMSTNRLCREPSNAEAAAMRLLADAKIVEQHKAKQRILLPAVP